MGTLKVANDIPPQVQDKINSINWPMMTPDQIQDIVQKLEQAIRWFKYPTR